MIHPLPPRCTQAQPISRPHQAIATPLPRWEDLPGERQRELIMTLAAILVKRLATQRQSRPEVPHE